MDRDQAGEVDTLTRLRAVRAARILLGASGVIAVLFAAALALPPRGLDQLDPAARGSLRLTDRQGRLLRDAPVQGARATWVRLSDLPPWVSAALVAAEDRRFWWHPGVDPLALARAAVSNVENRRIVSGGSTITQQVVRLMRDEPRRRTARAKLGEMLDALRLEFRMNRRSILEFYVNRVAFGRGAVGIEAAAQKYFGHAAATLSPAEAAWLAVLPRAPGWYARPEWAERLERRRLDLVGTLRKEGALDARAGAAALRAPEVTGGGTYPFEAPHLTGWLIDQLPPFLRGRAGTLRTTIDGPLQSEIEEIVRTQVARLSEKGARQAAVVVLDNATGQVLAMVGSADFFDEKSGGQVNGALARRQPGSALKPFTYALAFERDFTPASIVADVPSSFPAAGGPFIPRNYGGTTFGPVRLREALGSSLNIAAVDLLSQVGADRLYALLAALSLPGPADGPEKYGLGLTLGVGEVRLLDLTAAYGALASGGMFREPEPLLAAADPRGRALPVPSAAPPRRLIEPLAAWWVTDILRDDSARWRSFGRGGVLDMPWPVAAKTGTSSDWRDNWAMGYTRERTVGVWVGDFSGTPMQGVSGVWGAAPILRQVFAALGRRGPLTSPARPEGLEPVTLCSLSGAVAGRDCPGRVVEYFPADRVPEEGCPFHSAAAGGMSPTAGAPATRLHLPADYEGWARDRGWNVAASTESPGGTAGPTAGGVKLLTPQAGDVYFIDPALPAESQVVLFEARCGSGPAGYGGGLLEWSVDGKRAGATRSPHRKSWPLRPGRHQVCVSNGRERAAVQFTVVG